MKEQIVFMLERLVYGSIATDDTYYDLVGIFSTKEKAEEAKQGIKNCHRIVEIKIDEVIK